MNERIALLALKASDPETGWLDRQKFADLIIWECMTICEDVVERGDTALACWCDIKRTFRS